MEAKKKLRSTLLGGFNRRDVVAYIQELSAARERETTDLKRELERVSAERDAAKRIGGDVGELRDEIGALQLALDETTAKLRAAETERDELRKRADTTGAKLAEYESADIQLSEKLAELENVKARVIDIELEAQDRARKIEQDARDAAHAARSEADRLVSEMRWKFEDTRSVAGQSFSASIRDLENVKRTMESMLERFGDVSERLDRVTAREQSDADDDD